MLTHIGVSGVNFFSRPNFGRFPNKDLQNNPFIFACVTKNKNTMKSKVKLLGTLAISAISFLSYVQISHSEKLDDLLLENIEALAAGESGDDSKCFGSGSIVCPLTNQGVAHVQIYYSLPH